MAKPFIISKANSKLKDRYPSALNFANAARILNNKNRISLLRLFVTEGVPAAFEKVPLLYEDIRDFLANNLKIHPKEITLIGSARMRYSMAKRKYGEPMDVNSDLDFSACTRTLFTQMCEVFEIWRDDFNAGHVIPRNGAQKKYWPLNRQQLPENISRGFIDCNKIPSLRRYPLHYKIMNTLYLVQDKLSITPSAPQVKKVTLRVYCDWDAFFKQNNINLLSILKFLIRQDKLKNGSYLDIIVKDLKKAYREALNGITEKVKNFR